MSLFWVAMLKLSDSPAPPPSLKHTYIGNRHALDARGIHPLTSTRAPINGPCSFVSALRAMSSTRKKRNKKKLLSCPVVDEILLPSRPGGRHSLGVYIQDDGAREATGW